MLNNPTTESTENHAEIRKVARKKKTTRKGNNDEDSKQLRQQKDRTTL